MSMSRQTAFGLRFARYRIRLPAIAICARMSRIEGLELVPKGGCWSVCVQNAFKTSGSSEPYSTRKYHGIEARDAPLAVLANFLNEMFRPVPQFGPKSTKSLQLKSSLQIYSASGSRATVSSSCSQYRANDIS